MRFAPLVEAPGPLPDADRTRYARTVAVAGLGEDAQARLGAARVCVVGAGGLGSPVLLYLAGAGVGTLAVVDDDHVDVINLQRQVLHDEAGAGLGKAASAAARLRRLNGSVTVLPHAERLTAESARSRFAGYHLVIDATDNAPTRYVISDACAELGLPVVWGAVLGSRAQVSVFWSHPGRRADAPGAATRGLVLRDLVPTPPTGLPTAAEAGVFAPVCGLAGSAMAAEAIKLITGAGEPLFGRVLYLDALAGTAAEVPLRAGPA